VVVIVGLARRINKIDHCGKKKSNRKDCEEKKMFRVIQQSFAFATDVIPEMNKLTLNKYLNDY